MRDEGDIAQPTGDEKSIVEAAYSLTLAGDDPAGTGRSIAAFIELLDPDVVFVADDGARYSGREELRRRFADAAGDWHRCRFDVAWVGASGDGRVVAFGSMIATTAPDAEEDALPFANLWTFRNGRPVRIEAFADLAAAMRATSPKATDRVGGHFCGHAVAGAK